MIYADPAWKFASNSRARPGRNAQRHYEVMLPADIAKMPVAPLLARGLSLRHNKGVRELIVSHRREHSRKPDEFYERVLQYVGRDKRCLELFSRQQRPGIVSWGDQTDHFV